MLKPKLQQPKYNLEALVHSELKNGFLGLQKTSATWQVLFEKDEYYLGETAEIKVIYDGSVCEKDVEFVVIRLVRKI